MSKLLIGLTGGIGSGKTTIANLFVDLGITVIDADLVSRDILNHDQNITKQLIEKWGSGILDSEGKLNRRVLREIVFNDIEAKRFLEDILHPLIREKIKQMAFEAESPYALVVVPLMFETHFDELVERVVCVDLEVEKQIERTCLRDRISEELARKIIDAQIDREERRRLSDDIIYNCEDPVLKKKQVFELRQKFLKMVNHG